MADGSMVDCWSVDGEYKLPETLLYMLIAAMARETMFIKFRNTYGFLSNRETILISGTVNRR